MVFGKITSGGSRNFEKGWAEYNASAPSEVIANEHIEQYASAVLAMALCLSVDECACRPREEQPLHAAGALYFSAETLVLN